jgi:hypothetical protein
MHRPGQRGSNTWPAAPCQAARRLHRRTRNNNNKNTKKNKNAPNQSQSPDKILNQDFLLKEEEKDFHSTPPHRLPEGGVPLSVLIR